jgi:hypothetical protein
MPNRLGELLEKAPVVINLGIQDFAENLRLQGVEVVHVEWIPPAGGDRELMDLLEQML